MIYRKHTIGSLCFLVKGKYPTLKTEPGEYPLVVTASYRRTASTYQLESPAVCVPLISSTGHGHASIHRVHYQEGKFALANLLVALVPRDPNVCNAKYLFHLLMAKKDEYFVPLMLGTANVSLKEKDIANVEIPIPPINEQRRIVTRIEELAAKVGEMHTLRQQALKETQALPSSVSRSLFNHGRDWQWISVENCCEAIIDYRGRTPPLSEDGIPHLTSANIKNGQIIWDTKKFVSRETYATYMTRGIPKKGDVIFTMEAPLGEAAVVPDGRQFSLAQRTLLLRCKKALVQGEFLARVLATPIVHDAIHAESTGTTVKGIASKRLRHILLPVPSLQRQSEICTTLKRSQEINKELKDLQAESLAELDALLPSILDKAFRGEL